MEDSIFDPNLQGADTSNKIVVGLERISGAFRALLWEHAKVIGLSPIQIQVLIFLAYHAAPLRNVSHLAAEFNLTKPTISDAVRVLIKKGMVSKSRSDTDHRAFTLALTSEGRKVVAETEQFPQPIKSLVDELDASEQEQLFAKITHLIRGLNRSGILSVQRTCSNCRFYSLHRTRHHCGLLQTDLLDSEIRLDCPEFEASA